MRETEPAASARAVATYYLVTLSELTGEYDSALDLIDQPVPRDPRLAEFLADLRVRLPEDVE